MADQHPSNQPNTQSQNPPAEAPDPNAYDSVNNPGGRRPGDGTAAPAPEQPQPPGQPVQPLTTENTKPLTDPRRR